MMLLATETGVYDLGGSLKCCRELDVNDLYFGERAYICAWQGLYVEVGGRLERLAERQCWRLFKWGGEVLAALEGPIVYNADRGRVAADYRGYAKELGWHFFYGEPHITDFAVYKGEVVATVEVGHLLSGPSPQELRPTGFEEDLHNLLPLGDRLLIAAAGGVYYTDDLAQFKRAAGGYCHALSAAGGSVAAHLKSKRPIIVSRDRGESWQNLGLELPPPDYGTTGLLCEGGRCIYSTTYTYAVNVERASAERLLGPHPTTRRVVLAKE
ncbi:hypothetical protein [Pyrobaculum calidifontis]|uniref:Uncharacterized protein n=1 Tax=Pyrobaculum calidifontis (strain DSM 21063 / JCM 11548 / VA1) TaxID=410359 RepID=A3MW72_PYRCJ|nr:hypothetical protein [Pyrobaculum calidifontis]ABO08889.1 conserved hypothetical protein [Pyrobaculum calidifontis JCM 11548]